MKSKIKFNILVVISIIVLCIGVTNREFQNDTFYMIKLGDYIVHNGIDLMDHWCWITNLSYSYPHWLFDVFLYFIYSNFNYVGIYVSVIIFFIILMLCIYKVNLKFNKNYFMAFLITILSIFGFSGFMTARSQIVSYIIFILEIYFIEMLINTGKKRYVVYLILLSLLLANVHATIWLFYFILFLPFIGEHIIYKLNIRLGNKVIINCINNFKLLLMAFVGSFVVGIFSPSRICYSYVFKVMLGDSQSYITEHLPLTIINNPLFLGLVLVLLFVLIFFDTKIKLKELFMIGGLIFMSLVSARHCSLFYLIGVLYISVICMRCLNDRNDYTFDYLFRFILNNNFIYFLVMIGIVIFGGYFFYRNSKVSFINEEIYPVGVSTYIKENMDLDDFRLFNDYNVGAYLMFNDIPVFIDSRCDLYLSEFNGKDLDIFDDARNFIYDYEGYIEKYDINYILIDKVDVFYLVLIKDDNFVVEYDDDYFCLFRYVV